MQKTKNQTENKACLHTNTTTKKRKCDGKRIAGRAEGGVRNAMVKMGYNSNDLLARNTNTKSGMMFFLASVWLMFCWFRAQHIYFCCSGGMVDFSLCSGCCWCDRWYTTVMLVLDVCVHFYLRTQ